jgi:SAM-dependent methyltransferase
MSASPRLPPPVPGILRLVQEVVLGRWQATGEELYREVAALTEAAPGREVIISGAGDGTTAEWLAKRTGASITAVDSVPERIERAEARLREATMPPPVSFQHAALDDLPHENTVFDAAIGEPLLSSAADPARAVSELARVTKPMGVVVLLQLTWSSAISTDARELVVERLGMRPYFLVEWKQMMRDAGLVEIDVQDWTSSGTAPARDAEAPELSLPQKMRIAGRAWRRLGLRGARRAVARESQLLKELARERSLGFQLLRGVKWPYPAEQG